MVNPPNADNSLTLAKRMLVIIYPE